MSGARHFHRKSGLTDHDGPSSRDIDFAPIIVTSRTITSYDLWLRVFAALGEEHSLLKPKLDKFGIVPSRLADVQIWQRFFPMAALSMTCCMRTRTPLWMRSKQPSRDGHWKCIPTKVAVRTGCLGFQSYVLQMLSG